MMEQRELDPLACFLTACEIERREHRAARREHKVVDGRRISAEQGRFFYCFNLSNESNPHEGIREGVSVQLIIGEAFYHATVCEERGGVVRGRSVTLAVGRDLGSHISTARIQLQDYDLLQALIARLKDLCDVHPESGWNDALARRVLQLGPEPVAQALDRHVHLPDDLTPDQKTALVRCLSQPVTYVWGPPGTGKTVLLAALALQLYCDNKRVLIVSHTNHAVDGVVESLCRRITERGRSSVAEGSILRLGTIVRESLVKRYGDQVSLDAVIDRSHNKVSLRLAALSEELGKVREQLFAAARQLALIDTERHLRTEVERFKASNGMADIGYIANLERALSGVASDSAEARPGDDLAAFMEECLAKVRSEVAGLSKDELNDRTVVLSSRQLELTEAIAVLQKFIRDLRLSLLDRARIIATTATQALLSARDLQEFDAVLIDEASMLPLPLCFLLSGCARERTIIAGDFRQLPAISRSDSPMVQMWYSRDVFECSGVVDLVDSHSEHRSVVALTTQFRSHETLCGLINDRFYGGILRTKTHSADGRYLYRDPLAYFNRSPVVLVDTSELAPWGETENGSKLNLLHALVVRKVVLLLSAHGIGLLPEALGVIVPYRAQADLIRSFLDECSIDQLVSVGTVHKFQGSERDTIVLDLTESAPHTIGRFINPQSLRDTGARLLNVALSRARKHLIVVADLKHLRSQISMRSLLWGVLDDLERVGYQLSVSDLISEQIFATPSREVCSSPGVLAFQAFDEGLFMPGLVTDLLEARSDVFISSNRISERVLTVLTSVLEGPLKRKVRVVVRVCAGMMSDLKDQSVMKRLERQGVLVLQSQDQLPAAVVIDNEVLWLGALAPLDSLGGQRGLMVRTVSMEASRRTLAALEGANRVQRLERVAL